MRFHSYIATATEILRRYDNIDDLLSSLGNNRSGSKKTGRQPFASFLKNFFSEHKKYGSNDRKHIAHLCYCYFRLGKAASPFSIEKIKEQMLAGLLLCSQTQNDILGALKPEWDDETRRTVNEKFSLLADQISKDGVFPWKRELSHGIDHEKLTYSFFVQPDLFLRIRPGYEQSVPQKLSAAGMRFTRFSSSCLSMPNSSKVERVLHLDTEVVIQDYNSQKIGGVFAVALKHLPSPVHVWDCCAGSGGKSLLLYDMSANVVLTVSDIRNSILANLKKRFERAAIKDYRSFAINLKDERPALPALFDLIICDVPCSGSGTWSRTPEQLCYFDEAQISRYVSLQRAIVSNVTPYLKPGGFLAYITCSVFKKENELNAEFIERKCGLRLVKQELLYGYDKKADTMYTALFQKLK